MVAIYRVKIKYYEYLESEDNYTLSQYLYSRSRIFPIPIPGYQHANGLKGET
jgi:hypothetical protein